MRAELWSFEVSTWLLYHLPPGGPLGTPPSRVEKVGELKCLFCRLKSSYFRGSQVIEEPGEWNFKPS